MKLAYPKISFDKDSKVFVTFYINKKRYRLYNGDRIGIKLIPNTYPVEERYQMGKLLASEVYKYVQTGNTNFNRLATDENNTKTIQEYLKLALNRKIKSNLSKKYLETLEFIYTKIVEISKNGEVNEQTIEKLLSNYVNATSYNTIRTHLRALIGEAMNLGLKHNPMQHIKRKRQEEKLHKPFNNIKEVLDEIKEFNANLYLCCLLTYGCLLRPHREIRELKWNDFSNDLNSIHLSGYRNKSGKNRIVPVPNYVRNQLKKGSGDDNIFTNNKKPLNKDYFKTLWGRFKRVSKLLEQDQTLYSFRHTGAIDIFKRTESLQKLQAAMGHSSLLVTTTYLRGLEVCELNKEDMPVL